MFIVYPNEDGGISVVIPTGEIPIGDVISKDVPAGPYLLVDALPEDRSQRGSWSVDWSLPSGSLTSIVVGE